MSKNLVKLSLVIAIVVLGIALMIYGGKKGSDSSAKILGVTTPGKVKIVEFADFQCPACAAAEPIVESLLAQYPGKIDFEFRHFPLPGHRNAVMAAEAAEAAREQGKFDEMKHELYEKQNSWAESADPLQVFLQFAESLGLDREKFITALESRKFREKIESSFQEGSRLGINATPTFFVNGKKLVGVPGAEFEQVFRQELNSSVAK